MADETDLPITIRKAKALLLEALRLLDVHGRMRVVERQTHNGRLYIFVITIPIEDTATSVRDLKRQALRQRG